jgi:alkanesulfonate monooxygenase SsuD/methylene tetrahydromethanopterin reductase-like flavin-dependent oxidoreductase (luciferase family)
MDHLHQIDAVGNPEEPILEAYTTLAALAAVTRSARLGVLVTACGFRNPALLAKMVTTIDVISRGRALEALAN